MLISTSRPSPQLDDILERVGVALDISDELYQQAVKAYEGVGKHLARPTSRIAAYSPQVYPQGSFVLGTMIIPVLEGCEYDVDSVVTLDLTKEQTTQAALKKLLGDELRLAYGEVLEERRRCWTLQFRSKFHLDVLPTIPDRELGGTAVLLTDTDLHRWQHSNPKTYARWFEARMAPVLYEMKKAMAIKLNATVDDIPNWRVRTPLQRVVQLLKRHRDLFFREDLDLRPASIIVTTLAAQSYRGQRSVADALTTIAGAMPLLAAPRDGLYQILNPVNPLENFADKWNENPALPKRFLAWTNSVQTDLATWMEPARGLVKLSESLSSAFGGNIVKKALVGHGEVVASSRSAGALALLPGAGKLTVPPTSAEKAIRVRPHTFYGE